MASREYDRAAINPAKEIFPVIEAVTVQLLILLLLLRTNPAVRSIVYFWRCLCVLIVRFETVILRISPLFRSKNALWSLSVVIVNVGFLMCKFLMRAFFSIVLMSCVDAL